VKTALETRSLRTFGLRVRKLRNARGWTLEEAEDFGWPSWRHLQEIESGKKNVNLTTLIRLAKLFSVDPSVLIRGL
jgi:transcriptional regulator with XRE-family HTH domain